MSVLDGLLQKVKDTVLPHSNDQGHTGAQSGGLLNQLESMFGQPAQPDEAPKNVRPASEDPYGDPAGGAPAGRNVRPASEDPYGDPADEPHRR